MTPFELDMIALMPRLRRLASVLTRDSELAADMVQEAVELALRHHDKFTVGTSMWAWLSTILRNRLITYSRRAWRWVELPDGTAERIPVFPDVHDRLDLADTLRAMGRLPDRMRDAMGAVCIDDLSYIEAGEVFGCPDGTIKSLVSRGRAELRGQLA